jgi:voltage-gated potassium channel
MITVAVLLPHSPNRDPFEHWHFVKPLFIPLGLFWLAFLAEFAILALLYGRGRPPRQHAWAFAGALLPPLRLAVRPAFAPRHVWIPGKGWRLADNRLVFELEQLFSTPMILVALLILPILGLEMLWADTVESNFWLMFAVEVGVVFIWLVFAVEFFTMIAAHNEKLGYCKAHWIDLLIILLPLVAFLRVLRVARLGKLVRLERMSRVYRLRGVFFRFLRALVLFEVLLRMSERLARKRVVQMRKQLRDLEERAQLLRDRIVELEADIDRRQCEREAPAETGD